MATMKYVKREQFDPTILKQILNHDGIGYDTKQQLKRYNKKRTNGNVVEVIYDYASSYRGVPVGRVYVAGGIGLQAFERDVRNALARKLYHDVDIENAHASILLTICRENGWMCDKLAEYVNHRELILRRIVRHYNCDRKDAKGLMLRQMFLGSPDAWVGECVCDNAPNHLAFVDDFKSEMINIAKNVWAANPTVADIVKKKRNCNETRKLASCLSLVLQTEEHRVLMAIDDCLRLHNRSLDVFIFDGGLVRKKIAETDFPEELLRACEDYIKRTLTYEVRLAVKPMETSLSFDSNNDMEYNNYKAEFEKKHFKVMRPLMYVEELDNGEFYTRTVKELKDAFCNVQVIKNGDTVDFVKTWVADPTIRTFDNVDFLPPPLPCPARTFNLWRGFAIERDNKIVSSGDTQPFINHLNVLVNHDSKGLRYCLAYFADMVQRPGRMPGTALVFKSSQGAGKNIFLDLFHRMFGKDLFYETANPVQDIWSRFAVGRKNRIMINIDETSGRDTFPFSEQLKNMITSPNYNYEQKGFSPITMNNFNRIVFTTNNQNSLKIEDGDRRFCVFQCSDELKGNKTYFDGFREYIETPENLVAIFNFLKCYDISKVDWINDRPITELYSEMKDMNIPIHIKFFKHLVEDNNDDAVLKYSGMSLFDHFNQFIERGKFAGYSTNITAWGRLIKPLIVDGDDTDGFIKKYMSNGRVSYKVRVGDIRGWLVGHKYLMGCLL